jgi:colicin import membrane protein
MACLLALVSASCATTDSQSGVAQAPTLSQEDAAQLTAELQRQVLSCWNPPGVNVSAITVGFRLNRDGSLAGEPTLVKAASGAQSQATTESALRAVRNCAPFKLPAVSYEWWQQVEVNFDATRMFSSATLRGYEHRPSGQTDAQP